MAAEGAVGAALGARSAVLGPYRAGQAMVADHWRRARPLAGCQPRRHIGSHRPERPLRRLREQGSRYRTQRAVSRGELRPDGTGAVSGSPHAVAAAVKSRPSVGGARGANAQTLNLKCMTSPSWTM